MIGDFPDQDVCGNVWFLLSSYCREIRFFSGVRQFKINLLRHIDLYG